MASLTIFNHTANVTEGDGAAAEVCVSIDVQISNNVAFTLSATGITASGLFMIQINI